MKRCSGQERNEAGCSDAAGGPSPVIGRWLLVAIAADLQAETGVRLVRPQ